MGDGVILIVDDDARNRLVLRALLADEYQLVEARDARQALLVLESRSIDLVLLDVMMPEMDGYQACREIKRRAIDGFLPVILLTALGEQDDRNRGLESGADDFLTKPFDPRELRLRVRSMMALRRQQRIIREQFEALRNLDALKDDLVSLIVHDLRNPLAGMMALLEVMRDDTAAAGLARDLQSALGEAGKMREILDDLLRVRMLEDGRLPIHRELLPVGRVIDDAVQTVLAIAREKGVRLVESDQEHPSALLDRHLVSRALWNLLANAVRYSPQGETVEVAVCNLDRDVVIDVADRGPGIPEPMLGNVFEKFQSTGHRMHGSRQGFGLGLYLVRLVATAHDGSATALQRDGGGTIFRMRLPRAIA